MKYYEASRAYALLLICLMLVGAVKAQTNPERETLVGLRAVGVVVEYINPELERAGIAREQIQTDVELRLRRAGIQVIDSGAYLYVNINALRQDEYSFAYSTRVQFNQPVILERNTSISTIATTWERGTVGVAGNTRLQTIREGVGNLVDMFINDFLASSSSASNNAPPPPANRTNTPDRNSDSPFVARYVGGNRVPEIEITNSADRILNLT